jgi:hypothetical protein
MSSAMPVKGTFGVGGPNIGLPTTWTPQQNASKMQQSNPFAGSNPFATGSPPNLAQKPLPSFGGQPGPGNTLQRSNSFGSTGQQPSPGGKPNFGSPPNPAGMQVMGQQPSFGYTPPGQSWNQPNPGGKPNFGSPPNPAGMQVMGQRQGGTPSQSLIDQIQSFNPPQQNLAPLTGAANPYFQPGKATPVQATPAQSNSLPGSQPAMAPFKSSLPDFKLDVKDPGYYYDPNKSAEDNRKQAYERQGQGFFEQTDMGKRNYLYELKQYQKQRDGGKDRYGPLDQDLQDLAQKYNQQVDSRNPYYIPPQPTAPNGTFDGYGGANVSPTTGFWGTGQSPYDSAPGLSSSVAQFLEYDQQQAAEKAAAEAAGYGNAWNFANSNYTPYNPSTPRMLQQWEIPYNTSAAYSGIRVNPMADPVTGNYKGGFTPDQAYRMQYENILKPGWKPEEYTGTSDFHRQIYDARRIQEQQYRDWVAAHPDPSKDYRHYTEPTFDEQRQSRARESMTQAMRKPPTLAEEAAARGPYVDPRSPAERAAMDAKTKQLEDAYAAYEKSPNYRPAAGPGSTNYEMIKQNNLRQQQDGSWLPPGALTPEQQAQIAAFAKSNGVASNGNYR